MAARCCENMKAGDIYGGSHRRNIVRVPSAAIASTKGFKPFRWLVAFGLITVLALNSANEEGISENANAAPHAQTVLELGCDFSA